MSLKKIANKVKKENKANDLTITELFTATLDEFLINRETKKSSRLAFNPSGYYKCSRLLFYKLRNVGGGTKKKFARSERILNHGTVIHEWVQREVLMEIDKKEDSKIKLIPMNELPSYGKEGIEYIPHPLDRAIISVSDTGESKIIEQFSSTPNTEIKFIDRRWTKVFPISAMIDGAFTFMNKDMVFEFKTINPNDFTNLIEPLVDHIKQGAIYALSTGIRNVMFLYYNKGNSEWRAFLVEYTQEQLDWVVNRIQTIENMVLNLILPPKEESNNCNFCEFRSLCEKDEIGIPEEKI